MESSSARLPGQKRFQKARNNILMRHISSESKKDELDLHRLTVDEAIPRLDEFLHTAFRSGYYRVWVIHGKGSGILKQEVGRFLAKHSLVKSYHPADSQRGGSGATQVELSDK